MANPALDLSKLVGVSQTTPATRFLKNLGSILNALQGKDAELSTSDEELVESIRRSHYALGAGASRYYAKLQELIETLRTSGFAQGTVASMVREAKKGLKNENQRQLLATIKFPK